jgi:hypothetical protein
MTIPVRTAVSSIATICGINLQRVAKEEQERIEKMTIKSVDAR